MKTKLRKTIACIALGAIFISGCGRDENILLSEEMATPEVEDENPFDMAETEQDVIQNSLSYGWGINNYDKEKCEIEPDGSELTLGFTYSNSGPEFQAGIVIFIDGIAQKYSLNGKEGYIVPVCIQDGSTEESSTSVEIKLTPQCVMDGKEHIVYMGSVLEPEFRVKKADNTYGINFEMSVLNPWKLIYDADKNEVNISTACSNVPIPESISERYIYDEPDGKTTNKLKKQKLIVFEQDGEQVEAGFLDTSKKVYMKSVGGMIEKYRLCCMVNNSPYPAFDGCCYADVDVTSENMTRVEMDFSKEKVEDLSCMYVVLCPYSDDGMPEEGFLIDKTSNYTLTSSPPDTVSSEETKEQPELEAESESDVEKTGRIKNLSDYLESASCYNIIQVNEDVAACVSAKEERYAVDFLNLRSGDVIKSIESGFDGLRTPIDIDVDVAGSYVVCRERSFSVSDYGKENVYVLDDKYEVIETLALSGKVTNQAYTVLPAQRKILYVDYYGKEWKSCLKEMDFDGKNKKTILKFSEQSKLDDLSCMKVSPDEKKIYFTGCYEDNKNSGGNIPRCIGLIDLEEKDYEVYHEEKGQICVEKDGAYFYDANSGETDGKVCRIAYDGKISHIQTGETESGDTGFSIGKNLFRSVSTIKCDEGEEDRTPDILRIYDVKDGTLVYEGENMYISFGALVFDEERIICGLYIGDEGMRIKAIQF